MSVNREDGERFRINNSKTSSEPIAKGKKEKSSKFISKISARLPIPLGEFRIHLFKDFKGKEHLALVMGDVKGKSDVLVRIHSECFTGDIFDSMRCDCGEQLRQSIQIITEAKEGILIYLRQEGRGIGLSEKLKTYNLQDRGLDTVDANIVLGHEVDERDYTIATKILKDLGVNSIRLISNNPSKFNSLDRSGIEITSRISLNPRITSENAYYLSTKISKMGHLMDLDSLSISSPERGAVIRYLSHLRSLFERNERPFITLSFAQSIDGCISFTRDKRTSISGEESKILTHELRANHDAILVGINTIISDDPRLTTRLTKGQSPIPIVLDTNLRFPHDAELLKNKIPPLIVTGKNSDILKQRKLEKHGAIIIQMPHNNGNIELPALLRDLTYRKIKSIMVEGGARVISSFVREKLVDMIVLTISPFAIGNGLHVFEEKLFDNNHKSFSLKESKVVKMGDDFIIYGIPRWKYFK
ncbi:MAG: GTP cyclohydrolase II [Candidatus Bathyarchaeota archaeon]|nr:GTP cyclohydrolase II [Candidatus Bathyarchaeota archaeon]